MRQTLLTVLEDAFVRQQALTALRAAPDLLPAAARSLQHAIDVPEEMRVDLLLLDTAAAIATDAGGTLGRVPAVQIDSTAFEPTQLVESVRAATPRRSAGPYHPVG